MQWRYLDLRRPASQQKLILRHRIVHRIRETLNELKFLEIETPILTKSTPEGARDYLVPSRVNPGRFFALPQSPQLFKQLLMVAGLERYFQIARCFRDEDLRADRQPEFTQLDLEMSFVDEEDVFAVIERVIARVFEELGILLTVPFPRLTHREAAERHQSDKPDLHTDANPWAFCWVTEFPLFRWDDQAKRWDAEHHPFTAPHPDDVGLLSREPGKVRARAYDLVLNGTELGSGSIRIHDAALQHKILRMIGLDDATIEQRFGFLLKVYRVFYIKVKQKTFYAIYCSCFLNIFKISLSCDYETIRDGDFCFVKFPQVRSFAAYVFNVIFVYVFKPDYVFHGSYLLSP